MDCKALTTGGVVTVAAFAMAWLLVRTSQSVLLDCVDAGEQSPVGEPPARPLGTRGEALAPPRCVALGEPIALANTGPGELAFGDGVFDGRAVAAVGVVRGISAERKASVVVLRLDGDGRRADVVDLGPARGDDPPPRPFFVGDKLYAARIETGRDRRRLSFVAVSGAGAVAATVGDAGALEQSADESLAFDVSSDGEHAFATWDDDEAGRGVVRVAAARPGTLFDGAPTWTMSAKTSDAEAPRIVPDGAGGAFVAWIARRPEGDAGGAAEAKAHALESPAEEREARSVEIAHVDAAGAVQAAVRLAPERVSDFDLERSGPEVVVVMRDEVAAAEARGARLVRQAVRLEQGAVVAGALSVVAPTGIGAADPILIDDGHAGLAMVTDSAERPRLLPVADTAAPDAAAPSLEPLLDTGRVLASRAASASPGVGVRIRAAGRTEGMDPS